jgi:hypothetical protein
MIRGFKGQDSEQRIRYCKEQLDLFSMMGKHEANSEYQAR